MALVRTAEQVFDNAALFAREEPIANSFGSNLGLMLGQYAHQLRPTQPGQSCNVSKHCGDKLTLVMLDEEILSRVLLADGRDEFGIVVGAIARWVKRAEQHSRGRVAERVKFTV